MGTGKKKDDQKRVGLAEQAKQLRENAERLKEKQKQKAEPRSPSHQKQGGLAEQAKQLRENAERLKEKEKQKAETRSQRHDTVKHKEPDKQKTTQNKQPHHKRSQPVAHAHHHKRKNPKENLQQILNLTRNINDYIHIYRQAYDAVKKGEFNETVFLRNLEELGFSDFGMQVQDLVPDNFSPERMLDLLEHAQKHIHKIQPKIELMVQDPSKLTVNLLDDVLVESKRALKDIVRDKEKLEKPGKAGNYICTMIARGFSDLGRSIIKFASSAKKELNKVHQQEFTKEEKTAQQVLVSGAKTLVGFFSTKAADKVEKATAKHLDIGSFQSKFKAEGQAMKSEGEKIAKHKRKNR